MTIITGFKMTATCVTYKVKDKERQAMMEVVKGSGPEYSLTRLVTSKTEKVKGMSGEEWRFWDQMSTIQVFEIMEATLKFELMQ